MVQLYYRYDKLDKTHCYGLIFTKQLNTYYGIYWNYWVWFYLGNLMKGKSHTQYRLYPYNWNNWAENEQKLLKQCKIHRSAESVAKSIFNTIKKHKIKIAKKPIK